MADEIKQETTPEAKVEVKEPSAKVEPKKEVEIKKEEFKKDNKPVNKQYNQKRDMKKPRRSSLGDNFEERIRIKRISKTTKGGRHMRFSALVIVGDRQGRVGFGIGTC